MSVGGLLLRGILVAIAPLLAWRATARRSFARPGRQADTSDAHSKRALPAGAVAALISVAIFMAVRLAIGPELQRAQQLMSGIAWLAFVAAVEETTKALAVGHSHSSSTPHTRTRTGINTGIGFATIEHLFFLTIAWPAFALRLIATTALHAGTGVIHAYTGARIRGTTRTLPLPVTWLSAITIHLLYNLALRHLDAILTF